MKHVPVLFALAIVTLTTSLVSAQKPTNYFSAYQKAQQGDKPLLVLITAEWCPPCQVMKRTTIPALMKRNAFGQCHYATVDLDREQSIARQLIGNRGVPQLIIFEKQNGKWTRRYLAGIQSTQSVEAFVAQATTLRTASANTGTVKK